MSDLSKEQIQDKLRNMHPDWRERWCPIADPTCYMYLTGCGCIGCANGSGGLARLGVTNEEWQEAMVGLQGADRKEKYE